MKYVHSLIILSINNIWGKRYEIFFVEVDFEPPMTNITFRDNVPYKSRPQKPAVILEWAWKALWKYELTFQNYTEVTIQRGVESPWHACVIVWAIRDINAKTFSGLYTHSHWTKGSLGKIRARGISRAWKIRDRALLYKKGTVMESSWFYACCSYWQMDDIFKMCFSNINQEGE